jgi:L-glutamine-phosphate cytidylyltransferase
VMSRLERPERAVFLIAGSSRRFNGLVEHKTLLRVGGQTLIERLIIGAASLGVTDFVFVLGASADRLRAELVRVFEADRIPHRQIAFVHNERYATTNNAVSLWLARGFLDRPLLLVEGDVVVDFRALQRARFETSLWFAVPGFAGDGSFVTPAADGRVVGQEIVRGAPGPAGSFKSASLLSFTEAGSLGLRRALEDTVEQRGELDAYVDGALRDALTVLPIYLEPIDEARWHEIDTPEDFYAARAKFATLEEALGPHPERPFVDPALR